jgi:glycine amidinotransferase
MDPKSPTPTRPVPVRCYNEWDPLEEMIVGVVEGAAVPRWDLSLEATMPHEHRAFFGDYEGKSFPHDLVARASQELEELVKRLESEGVVVKRPDRVDFTRPFATPDWKSPGGLYAAMPRDLLLTIGDELIEAPMSWRSRYFEIHAYRGLLKDYFAAGARWTSAPRPELRDELFDADYVSPDDEEAVRYVITEEEPTFDAADFIRCGRDLFAQRSNTTNAFGIEWLRRHLGDAYRIHEVAVRDSHPMHIDATFIPLAPGRALVNPERLPDPPAILRQWELLPAPAPVLHDDAPKYMSSPWISMNVISLDERRVVVEEGEAPLIAKLRSWGFDPIPCPFRAFQAFGGSFHCATLDVRRTGELESYFD